MKFPRDLVPQKAIAADLCVSLVTLWRARQSGIPGFPEPVVIRNMIFWRRDDVQQLEDALMKFEGRGKFEDSRTRTKRNAELEKIQSTRRPLQRPQRRRDERQMDLF
ncbi:MAG: hypothetical protein Q8R02_03600 [Hyphomonadaceae bacterium]|nr:hypothetical protein [Hyphomonadaceae bacterium]